MHTRSYSHLPPRPAPGVRVCPRAFILLFTLPALGRASNQSLHGKYKTKNTIFCSWIYKEGRQQTGGGGGAKASPVEKTIETTIGPDPRTQPIYPTPLASVSSFPRLRYLSFFSTAMWPHLAHYARRFDIHRSSPHPTPHQTTPKTVLYICGSVRLPTEVSLRT